VGADRFGGFYDNTDIFSRMAEVMGLKKAAAVTTPVVTPVVAPAKEAAVMAQAAN
jgi:alkaline phosphatase